MTSLLRKLLYHLVLKPVIVVGFGVWVRGRENLPADGPAILCVNHNSHLDLMVTLAVTGRIHHLIRPVAAAEYFHANAFLRFVSDRLLRIIPVDRTHRPLEAFLSGCEEVLAEGNVVLVFPEGTRGEPERMQELKGGITLLAERHPEVPVVPVFLHGAGRTLPRGAWLPVPFRIDVFVGERIRLTKDRQEFLAAIRNFFEASREQVLGRTWP
jgi:1-acyl-sn-glycerol-3-phosphate acyltransferase